MFWDPVTFAINECRHWQVGPYKLWVRRTAEEWQTISQLTPDDGAAYGALVEESPRGAWARCAATDDTFEFRLQPVLPDRPVIVRPESPFSFPPQSELRFYVSIPIWVRLCIGPEGRQRLREDAIQILSNSWFGDPMDGYLGYALRTTARRTPQALRTRPHLAACPVHIRNHSGNLMGFDRLCIHVAHLRLYHDGKRLWTNAIEVTYGGESQPDSIHYAMNAPDMATDARLITEAREPARKSLLHKSLSDLKSFVRI